MVPNTHEALDFSPSTTEKITKEEAGRWWPLPVILATREAEIGRI
jgi:hypothetical protein